MNIEEMSLEELSQRVFVSLSSWGIEGTNAFNEFLHRFSDLQQQVQELESSERINNDVQEIAKLLIADLQQQNEKGQRAIEAMEKISEVRFREGDDYAGKLYDITEIFLQYNKEK